MPSQIAKADVLVPGVLVVVVVGDSIFAVGILALGWFVLGLVTGWSVGKKEGSST